MTTKKKPARGVRPASPGYRKLIAEFPLRPIRSEDELKAALAVIERLMLSDLDDDERDYFETLGAFVEKYEKEHHAIPDATEGGILHMLMEGREVSQSQLSRETGIPQSTISAVLNGTRRMTRDQIEKFAAFFRKSPALFMPRVDEE